MAATVVAINFRISTLPTPTPALWILLGTGLWIFLQVAQIRNEKASAFARTLARRARCVYPLSVND
jgi:hypothetical protein